MNIQLAVTAQGLQAKISPIHRFVKVMRQFDATIIEVEGLVFPQHLYTLDRGMSVLQRCRWKFSVKETL